MMRQTAFLIVLGLCLAAAQAQEAMQVTVVSVDGVAHKRTAGQAGDGWQPVQAGDQLDAMTILRTGLGAKVVLRFADRGETTIRSATKVGIGEFAKQGDKVTTKLGLKYGSMKAHVDSTAGANDYQVKTPVATLSVRGTRGGIMFSGDFGLLLCGAEGPWNVGIRRRDKRIFAQECTDDFLTPSVELTKRNRHAKTSDPFALNDDEQKQQRDNKGGRGVFDSGLSNPALIFQCFPLCDQRDDHGNGYDITPPPYDYRYYRE